MAGGKTTEWLEAGDQGGSTDPDFNVSISGVALPGVFVIQAPLINTSRVAGGRGGGRGGGAQAILGEGEAKRGRQC